MMKWLFVGLLCTVSVACNDTDRGASLEDTARLGLTQGEVDGLKKSATDAAVKENYDTRNADLKLSKEGEHYKARFTRRIKDAVGGELHITMDRNGRIVRVYHGL